MSEIKLLPQDKSNQTVSVLKLVAKGVLISGSVVAAPNLLQLLADKQPGHPSRTKQLRAIRHAKDQGWLTFRETSKGVEVALSASGKVKWLRVELAQPLEVQKWDGRWHFVIFDIPATKKLQADYFRQSLKRLGLRQLQRSIWVTPYPCQTQIAYLRQTYGIKSHVQLIEAHSVENESELKRLFKLTLA